VLRPPSTVTPPTGYRLTALLAHSVLIQATTFLLRPAGTYQALAIQVPTSLLGLIGPTSPWCR
jgi:hypothetical protein